MGEFTELDRAGFGEIWRQPGRAYVFRQGVPAAVCEADWLTTADDITVWAKVDGVQFETSGQCFFFPEDQADYTRKIIAFKLRWC